MNSGQWHGKTGLFLIGQEGRSLSLITSNTNLPKTHMAMENSSFSIGDTSSNGCFFIVMLGFLGCNIGKSPFLMEHFYPSPNPLKLRTKKNSFFQTGTSIFHLTPATTSFHILDSKSTHGMIFFGTSNLWSFRTYFYLREQFETLQNPHLLRHFKIDSTWFNFLKILPESTRKENTFK